MFTLNFAVFKKFHHFLRPYVLSWPAPCKELVHLTSGDNNLALFHLW